MELENNSFQSSNYSKLEVPIEEFRIRGITVVPIDDLYPQQLIKPIFDNLKKNYPNVSLSNLTNIIIDTNDRHITIQAKIGEKLASFKVKKEGLTPAEQEILGFTAIPSTPRFASAYSRAISFLTDKNEWEDVIPLTTTPKKLTAKDRQDRDPYRIIEKRFSIGDELIGKEVIKRIDTLTTYQQILEAEDDQQELKKLNKYIETTQATWVKSQDFRSICHREGFKKACETFPLGAPVNLRQHSLEDSEGQVVEQIARLGVITDVSNGWYSLAELKNMEREYRENNNLQSLISKKEEIINFQESPPPSGIMQSILNYLFRVKGKLNRDQYISSDLAREKLQIIENAGDIKPLEELIEARRKPLQRQMLQYLLSQVSSHPDRLKEGQPFNLFHLSLLNLHTKHLDSSGWMHNERVAFEDMREIMHEFREKKLAFAKKGPVIKDDTIYLPIPDIPEGVTLNTFIFNFSPQGHTKNDNPQLEFNQQEMGKLRETLSNFPFEELTKIFQSPRTGYDTAEEFSMTVTDYLQEHKNGAFGNGCNSGKDRTGFNSARIMMRRLSKILPTETNPYESQILNKNDPATLVAIDNLPTSLVLKLDPRTVAKRDIAGFKRIETIGFLFRSCFAGAIQEIFRRLSP